MTLLDDVRGFYLQESSDSSRPCWMILRPPAGATLERPRVSVAPPAPAIVRETGLVRREAQQEEQAGHTEEAVDYVQAQDGLDRWYSGPSEPQNIS